MVKVGTSKGASSSVGSQVEGTHTNIPRSGNEAPSGWKGHSTGAQSLKKAGKGSLPKETNSGDL